MSILLTLLGRARRANCDRASAFVPARHARTSTLRPAVSASAQLLPPPVIVRVVARGNSCIAAQHPPSGSPDENPSRPRLCRDWINGTKVRQTELFLYNNKIIWKPQSRKRGIKIGKLFSAAFRVLPNSTRANPSATDDCFGTGAIERLRQRCIRRLARCRCFGSRRTHVLFEQRSSKHRFPVEGAMLLEDLRTET